MPLPSIEQITKWWKPEVPTTEELEWAEKIVPGQYEVYVEKINAILTEAFHVFTKVGLGYMVRSGDITIGLSDAKGDVVGQYCGLYHYTLNMPAVIKYILKYYKDDPLVGIKEGDIFFSNDPQYGGTHYNDMVMAMPIFWGGNLVAWSFAGFHEGDTGGMEPGGMCPSAKIRYAEGLKVTPMRVGENFKLKPDILEYLCCSVRIPFIFRIDLAARASTCQRIHDRVLELFQEKGSEFVLGLFTKILRETEQAVRKRIKAWNDGVYRAVWFTENTRPRGVERYAVTVTKEDDRITIDYTGTGPEDDTSGNCNVGGSAGSACVTLLSYVFHDLPASNAALAPVEWKFPLGTLVAATPDAAVGMGMVKLYVTAGLPVALSKIMFDSEQRYAVNCVDGNSGTAVALGGLNEYGRPFQEVDVWSVNTSGQGAHVDRDGMDVALFSFGPSAGRALDQEEVAEIMPIVRIFAEISKGPHAVAHGKYRGGASVDFAFTPVVPYVGSVVMFWGGANASPNQGLFGGYPTACFPLITVNGGDVLGMMSKGEKLGGSLLEFAKEAVGQIEPKIKGKYTIYHPMDYGVQLLMKGDVYVHASGGGSAYGDVLERDPEAVLNDVKRGLVSKSTAKNLYHVAINHETMEVDDQATKRGREEERRSRIKRGKSYEEFNKEWLQKKPSDQILSNYGTWPDAKKTADIIRF